MAWTKRKEGKQQARGKAEVCPHCGALIKGPAGKKQRKWHERTSVTLCVAAGLAVAVLGFVHVITGIVSPYGLPFDVVRKDAFGYRETFVDARKIGALPYPLAWKKYPLGCEVLQRGDYMPSGNAFETRTRRNLQGDMSQWQAEFEHALNRPQSGSPWADPAQAAGLEQLRTQAAIIETDPQGPAACNSRGIASAKDAQYENAIAEFSRAVSRDPTFADAHYNRAIVYAALGQLGQAVADLTIVIEIKPEFTQAYRNRGIIQAALDQYDQAASDFTRVLELDPADNETYMRRSLVAYAKGDYEKAWADVREMQSLGLPVPAGFLESLRAASGK
jgi:tetratricopeptide (TPR) repeat protein